jgi:hypothetical protein
MPQRFLSLITRSTRTLVRSRGLLTRINADVLPHAEARLARADASIKATITRQLEMRDRMDEDRILERDVNSPVVR